MKLGHAKSLFILLRDLSDTKLKAKTSFKVALLLRKLEPYSSSFDDANNKLIESFGTANENGVYYIDRNNEEDFSLYISEISSLAETEVDVDGVPRFSMSDLEEIQFTPAECDIILSSGIVEVEW